jgi:hypothetical protein
MQKYVFLINSPWLRRIARSDGAAFVEYKQFGMVAHPLLGGRADARAVERRICHAGELGYQFRIRNSKQRRRRAITSYGPTLRAMRAFIFP